jgi:hypothetical protein
MFRKRLPELPTSSNNSKEGDGMSALSAILGQMELWEYLRLRPEQLERHNRLRAEAKRIFGLITEPAMTTIEISPSPMLMIAPPRN